MTRGTNRYLMLIALLNLAACGGPAAEKQPLNSETAKLTVYENLEQNMAHMDQVMEAMGDELSGLFRKQGPCISAGEVPPAQAAYAGIADDCGTKFNIKGSGKEFTDFLKEQVFVPENLESDADNEVVYNLPAVVVCGDDLECQELVGKHPIRLRLFSLARGNVEVAFQFGKDRIEPVIIGVHRSALTATLDVALAHGIFTQLQPADIEQPKSDAEGKIKLALGFADSQKITASLAVLKVIKASYNDETGPVTLTAQPGEFKLELDAAIDAIGAYADLGTFVASAPYQLLVNQTVDDVCFFNQESNDVECQPQTAPTVGGQLKVMFDGLTANAMVHMKKKLVEVTGFGFGQKKATLMLDDHVVFGIDLNKQAGRTIDFSAGAVKNKLVEFRASALLDLSIQTGLSALSEIVDEKQIQMIPDDVVGIVFSGAQTPTAHITKHSLQVLAGTIEMTSQAFPELNMTVAQGQCLLQAKKKPKVAHLLSRFAVKACH